jgi:tRNA 2-thiouridine synthesizing protein A
MRDEAMTDRDEDWRHAAALDLRGLQCPLPVLKARKKLISMKPGERLLVEATDPLAALDFPAFCNETGHRLVATEQKDKVLRFLIERA